MANLIPEEAIWRGPPFQDRIREIQWRYIWDEYNHLGFGYGQIIDRETGRSVIGPTPEALTAIFSRI